MLVLYSLPPRPPTVQSTSGMQRHALRAHDIAADLLSSLPFTFEDRERLTSRLRALELGLAEIEAVREGAIPER